ncbi:hypothetical protein [Nocardiopsis ansamitocini]|uniref:Uncharacterized protein n=1 Tax=Nocardiopsis ansamitocini TaxID=1670832 RepID=A0A9W6P7A0_9ACTN|nr:hypothetical protein [Nocardiopsis ansamitocini]GLU48336.1 hypothetical protein Nans01_26870 [Nocardiopsis ansamitocini]
MGSPWPLAERVDALLDDGTGRPNPQLEPLKEAILATPRHRSVSSWIRGPKARLPLREPAEGSLPLTHRAFHEHPEWRAAALRAAA